MITKGMGREEGAPQTLALLTVGPHSFISSQCVVIHYCLGVTLTTQASDFKEFDEIS